MNKALKQNVRGLLFGLALFTGQNVVAQNPFPTTAIRDINSQSVFATTQNAFATNNCTTGSQDLRGQCTWYVAARVQELRASGRISQNSANTVYNSLCGSGNRHANRWHLLISGNWVSTSSSQPLPISQRQPGMIVTWDYGTYGHVAFVEEISADKTSFRISEFNVSPLSYSEKWLSFNSPRVFRTGVSGSYPKFYALEVGVPVPVVTSPIANATMVNLPTTVRWNAITGADGYRIQISKFLSGWTAENGYTSSTSTSSTIPVNSNTGNTTSLSVSTLDAGTDYYITIRCNIPGRGASKYSTPIKFTTRVATPIPVSPTNGASGVPVPVNFRYNLAPGFDAVRLVVSTSLSNWTPEDGFGSTSTSSTVPVNVSTNSSSFTWNGTTTGVLSAPEGNKTYYYTMRVNVPGKGWSLYSQPQRFNTQVITSLNVTPMALSNLPATASVQSLTINAIGGIATVTSMPSWVRASQTTTIGIANIGLTVDANLNSTPRSGFVVVRLNGFEKSVAISQQAGYLNPSVTSLPNLAAAAATRTVTIASSSLSYTASSNVSWVTTRISGSTLTLNIAANTTTISRNATITLRQGDITKIISISQVKRSNLNGGTNSSNSLMVVDNVLEETKNSVDEDVSPKNIDNNMISSLYPNPVSIGDNVTLKIQSEIDENDVMFEVVALDGKTVLLFKQNLVKGENLIEINTSNLPTGRYILKNSLNNEMKKLEIK